MFDIKHTNNNTVTRHFHSHNDQLDPKIAIHILKYIRLPKDRPRSHSLSEKRELSLDTQTEHLNSQWAKYIGLKQSIQEEIKGMNKGQPAFFTSIMQSQGSFSGWKQP